ncbi:TonB-dependent receptor [Mucilaginibacter pocheonensis]|uniref:TonB-linked SusC/RagA family outer membrane protein n=1 Tax=Mucilaginibacter pocheonensis TaxID=398050 RepID=A0ABU1TFR7_9SPHI|nr:TonB-dependent receptor [Mucilaginibacter pocheonensis]MDR6944089.1 TonB-linked SusC/RagA family outer membrane protein [Mucilaginibacter pocheonensis]
MKLSFFLCLVSMMQVAAAPSFGQKISLDKSNASLIETLKDIRQQSGFSVFYNAKMLKKAVPVNVHLENTELSDVLKECFKDQPFSYVINNNTIVVIPKPVVVTSVKDIVITGHVRDEKGAPLPGVTIKIKGTNVGAQTGADGSYKVTAADNSAVLVFSFIGFVTREIPVGNQTQIDVVLKEQTSALNEIVVVGYGTQKKVNLTGAVSTVSGETLNKRPVVNPASMLEGLAPGVQVNTGSGEPGNESVSIRIRGNSTFSNAGSDPLVLIDGVPGNFSDLNPTDVENVSVLKDAASAAIYGSRAANGVVLITTKQGKAGQMAVTYNGNLGYASPTKMFKLVTNSAQYMEMFNQARINSGTTDPNALYPQDQIDLYRNSTDRLHYPNTDWLSLIFRTAPTQNHNLVFTGGNEKTTYNVSLGYVNQQGIERGFDYKRYNARVNLTSKVNDHIKFGTNVLLKSGTRGAVAGNPSSPSQWDGSSMDLFLSAMSQAPTYSPYLSDGSGHYTYKAYDFEYNNKNPIAVLDQNFRRITDDYAVNAQGWFEVQFNKDISWYTKGAVNFNMDKYKDFKATLDEYNFKTNQLATSLDLGKGLTDQDEQTVYSNLYSYLNYAHDFHGHNLKAQFGYSIERSKYQYLQGYRKNFPVLDLQELNAGGSDIQNAYGTSNQWALMSYFGRLNYDYKGRYLLEANVRDDGSSKFDGANKWGVFPSFSAGWRVTEEPFVKAMNLTWLNNFKLRGSWGQLGNQNVGSNYPYQALLNLTGSYSFDNSGLTTGVAQQALNNPVIKWETTTMTDVGLDFTIFRNFNLTADWYNKTTSDILRLAQVTGVVGLSAPYINDGVVNNRGVELGLSYNNVIRDGALGGLAFNVGVNVDHNRNKLVKFGQPEIGDYTLNQNGLPWNSFYMLQVVGIFQSAQEVANSPKQFSDSTLPGDLKYKDANGDGKIDQNDRTVINGAYPKLNYSFNLSASFKGFDLSAMMQGVYGVKSYVSGWGTIPFVQGASPTTDWLNAWTPEHPSTTMPRLYFGQSAPDKIGRRSTFFLQDASYLRLKNLVFGYTIPSQVTQKIGINRLRVYFAGDNMFTITKYKGLDPERYGNGDLQYPQNKIYSFGLNVTF